MENVSVVVPLYNEEGNVHELYERIAETRPGEIVFVDDGSTDRTFERLEKVAQKNPRVKLIRLARNYGKSAALAVGFRNSSKKTVATLDGDLQNDPRDIPRLVERLKEADLVCGWRKKRHDPFFSKKVPSKVFNWLVSILSGLRIHDSACALMAYKRNVLGYLDLYGGRHRLIPLLAHKHGFRVVEEQVSHSPRKSGKSKYGALRILRGSVDLVNVVFFERFRTRPVHMLGIFGFLLFSAGSFLSLYLAYEKLFLGQELSQRPLFLVAVVSVLLGLQFATLGVLSEMITHLRYDSGKEKNYRVLETRGLGGTKKSRNAQ